MDQKIKAILLACLILTGSVQAETIILNQDEKAPFTGYLMDKETGKTARIRLIEGEEAKALNLSYAKSIEQYQANELLYQSQVKTVLEQNDNLSKSLRGSQSMSTWERVGWFVLGMAAVSAGAYGISRVK